MINDSLNNYISELQLLAFFAGYPLIYTLVNFLATKRQERPSFLSNKWVELLPFAYGLIGTLFIGLFLKNISPDFSLKNIMGQFQSPFLEVWAFISVLFWIPAFSKKPVFSLLHSLPFFFLLINHFFTQTTASGRFVIDNDMKMYTISFLLNMAALAFIYALLYCLRYFRFYKNTTAN